MNEQTKQTICGLLLYLLETASSNERLVYGWRKIMENITSGYGHHE